VLEPSPSRDRLLVSALWLSGISVAWGVLAGTASVTVGLIDGSLGVVGLGLNVLADVTGSIVLLWRFRAELHHAARGAHAEARASVVIAAALGVVSVVLTVSAVRALAIGSHPGHSPAGIVVAGLASLVLAPLAREKRRVAARLDSSALRGDSTLSAVGAAIGVLAIIGLLLDDAFGWWWADRVAALSVGVIAAAEAIRTWRERETVSR
jgi:divalent metal cation (Fe/Co/Zn/Cd) transporter